MSKWMTAIVGSLLIAGVFCAGARAARSETGTPRVMEGPMVGVAAPDAVTVWVRLSGEYEAVLEVSASRHFRNAVASAPVRPSRAGDDCTAVLRVEGLSPATPYFYRILVNGKPDAYLDIFQTKTAPAGPARFAVAFGSCPRVQRDRVQPIWTSLQAAAPDLFFWIGDNIYGDSLDPQALAEEYRRQRAVASLQGFIASVPQLAVWDDHDFGLNDHDRTNPVKEASLGIFKRYWANPSYGLPDTPGVFFRYAYGGVDFFLLDCRYHRDPNTDPDTPEKTFLGAGQLAWLQRELKASTSPFKVLVSGSGWTCAKGEGGDSWAAFLHERNRLFDFIRDEGISGVILISGDTHVGEFNAIPRSDQGGYDLYDLVSSPLAQKANTGWRKRFPELRVRTPYEGDNAGRMVFDMTGAVPSVELNLMDVGGKPVWTPVVLTPDDLCNGAATARRHADFKAE